jgi:hypothetical protein
MRKLKDLRRLLWVLLATSLSPGLWSGEAAAEDIVDTNTIAAALALPVDVGEMRETHHLITNTGAERTVQVWLVPPTFVSAGRYECHLDRSATLHLRFYEDNGATKLEFDCVSEEDESAYFSPRIVPMEQGIVFYSLVKFNDKQGGWETLGDDFIFGDATVIDMDQGTAYSFGAISFESGDEGNDGDWTYLFDNDEYEKWPARLATNFYTPVAGGGWTPTNVITAELVLFTLDGTLGQGAPKATLVLDAYNEDGINISGVSFDFSGFTIQAVDDVDSNIQFDPLNPSGGLFGSPSGHLVLTPQITTQDYSFHDFFWGNGDGYRRTAVHGWLVQTMKAGAHIGSGPYVASDPAWGRPLSFSESSLVPEKNPITRVKDTVVFDTNQCQGGSPC